jgi:putative GTP pyrophosphokinase
MPSLDYEIEKAAFREFYDENRASLEAALGSFRTLTHSLLATPVIAISGLGGRVKDRDECLKKFNRKYRTALEKAKTPYAIREKITDLIGLRVVCLYEDDVERVKDLVSKEFDVLGISDKTAQIEGTEDSFGYKGLHLDLKLSQMRRTMAEYKLYADHPFELQIRTVVQDSWSIIDHKIKYKKSIPNTLKRRINTLAALFELADREFRAIRDATTAEIDRADETYDEIEAETTIVEDNKEITKEVSYRRYAELNAFNFLRIAKHFFPNFEFESHKVDGFTQEIISLKPDITRGKLNYYLRQTIGDVKRYQADFERDNVTDKMNPYTVMRHSLYAGDQAIFAPMLTDNARDRFDEWRAGPEGRRNTTRVSS